MLDSENPESNETSAEVSETDEAIAALERHGVTFINAAVRGKTKKGNKPKMALRVDIPATTPSRTISAVMGMLWEDLINNPKKDGSGDSISRKKIQWAEKMIRGAFVELYKGLGLLKTFRYTFKIVYKKYAYLYIQIFLYTTIKILTINRTKKKNLTFYLSLS